MGGLALGEGLQLHGKLSYTVYRNKAPIERFEDSNLIMDAMRFKMIRIIAGDLLEDAESDIAGLAINHIEIGTNRGGLSSGNTEITGPFPIAIKGHEYPGVGQARHFVRFLWELLESEANGMAISEFGLVTDDGSLFARRTRERPLYKESDISIEGEWVVSL